MARLVAVALLFLFLVVAESRLIASPTSDLVSDGLDGRGFQSFQSLLRSPVTRGESSCEETYGFLPCTTSVLGNLFLVLVYGYFMFLGATYLSNGSEILLQILGPGIVGGLFLPVLGALPDAILILVSGLSGTKETAQSQVLIGMGVLAGSTVMLLTVLWGSCIVVGKCDLSDASSTAIDGQDSKRCSLSGSCVTTDSATSKSAGIMVLSVIPFIVVQLPHILHRPSWARATVVAALILSVVFLITYCVYQILEPWIQKRRMAYAKHKHVMAHLLRHINKHALGRLLDHHGEPSVASIEKMFHLIDSDGDSHVSLSELRALVIGIQFDEIDLDKEEAAEKIKVEFDSSGDNQLNKDEFVKGISKWILEARKVVSSDDHSRRFFDDFHQHTAQTVSKSSDESDEETEDFENPSTVCLKAMSLLLLGTVVAAAFADPLVDAVHNFSAATSIPSFFISFIALPFATNSSEAVSALIFASRKKQRTASLMFSEIYGGVTMNNILCLAVFLALVFVRGLTWDFSSEVLIILVVVAVMGIFANFRTTFPLWTCSIAYLLYPFSIALVYFLDYVLGWS